VAGFPDGLGEKELRAYFASVIGTFRAPFGVRSTYQYTPQKQTQQIERNTTADKVLSVFVSRNDLIGAVPATFSQQSGPATTDFAVTFDGASIFRFLLYPSESLSLTIPNLGPGVLVRVVVGVETY